MASKSESLNFLCCVVWFCLALWSGSGLAKSLKNVSAGILPYACKNGEVQFLLAYDPVLTRRGWGAFGGRPKPDEQASATALREFLEETNCSYVATDVSALAGPSRSGRFYSFVAQVPWRATEWFNQQRACVDVERSQWVWVGYEPFIEALKKSGGRPVLKRAGEKDLPLWSGAAASIRATYTDGLLPNEQACAIQSLKP